MSVADPFADVRPETPLRAARDEDHKRLARMLATDGCSWIDDDIDIVMSRAQTTIGGPETFKWILPAWLARGIAQPDYGWMTDSEALVEKLDRAGFDHWPRIRQAAGLTLLADWLRARATAHPDEPVAYAPNDDAALRHWLMKRRP